MPLHCEKKIQELACTSVSNRKNRTFLSLLQLILEFFKAGKPSVSKISHHFVITLLKINKY
jgi:hypothetical protein